MRVQNKPSANDWKCIYRLNNEFNIGKTKLILSIFLIATSTAAHRELIITPLYELYKINIKHNRHFSEKKRKNIYIQDFLGCKPREVLGL